MCVAVGCRRQSTDQCAHIVSIRELATQREPEREREKWRYFHARHCSFACRESIFVKWDFFSLCTGKTADETIDWNWSHVTAAIKIYFCLFGKSKWESFLQQIADLVHRFDCFIRSVAFLSWAFVCKTMMNWVALTRVLLCDGHESSVLLKLSPLEKRMNAKIILLSSWIVSVTLTRTHHWRVHISALVRPGTERDINKIWTNTFRCRL